MKIPNSLSAIYQDHCEINTGLSKYVEKILGSAAKINKWHYESRVKEVNSFVQKIETGRVQDLKSVEDLFACTLVVKNSAEIEVAKEVVNLHFDTKYCRPLKDDETHKDPSSFVFDDKRLYVMMKEDPSMPSKIFSKVIFEVQIKTFLQHAWAITTHDMMYKSAGINWAEERVAYQVKAMLENAEISIQEVKSLSPSSMINKTSERVKNIGDILQILNDLWDSSSLPRNRKILAETIYDFIKRMQVDVRDLRSCLKKEISNQKGVPPTNITPYSFFVQVMLKNKELKVKKMLNDRRNKKFIVVVDSNAELPEWFLRFEGSNVIIY